MHGFSTLACSYLILKLSCESYLCSSIISMNKKKNLNDFKWYKIILYFLLFSKFSEVITCSSFKTGRTTKLVYLKTTVSDRPLLPLGQSSNSTLYSVWSSTIWAQFFFLNFISSCTCICNLLFKTFGSTLRFSNTTKQFLPLHFCLYFLLP